MKKCLMIVFLLAISFSLYAGPFGLEKGMTLEQITEACDGSEPQYIKDDRYLISPKKSHPDFENYIVWVSKTSGLYYIKAISRKTETNGYGAELKSLLYDINKALSKIYGEPLVTDELDPKSVFTGDDYWMFTLAQGAREYYVIWESTTGSSMSDSINSIILYVTAENSQYGYVMLEYEFDNYEKVQEEKSSVF